MDLVVTMRLICLVSWVAVLIYMTSGVWALAVGRSMRGDPARLICWGFALMVIGFCARWFLLPDSPEAFAALYVFGTIWAWLTILAARSYGR